MPCNVTMKILSHIFRRKKIQYTPVDIELEPRVRLKAPDSGSKTWKKYLQGWRFTVATGACLSLCVLWANVGILLWAQKKEASSHNTITLFQGSCSQRDRIMALSQLAINILSTLLLGASSSCMQYDFSHSPRSSLFKHYVLIQYVKDLVTPIFPLHRDRFADYSTSVECLVPRREKRSILVIHAESG